MGQTLPVPAGFASGSLAQATGSEASGVATADAPGRAADYATASKSEATRRAYRSDWADFTAWCACHTYTPLPATPRTVANYLSALADAGRKAATIARRCAAIAYAHKLKSIDPPPTADEGVRAVIAGIRRAIGTAQEKKPPATAEVLKAALQRIPADLRGLRDKALLLLGFAAALRESELVGLDVEDLERVRAGLIVLIRKSKTDQEGRGSAIAVPRGRKLKPLVALDAWLAYAGIATGPIFRPIDKFGRIGASRLSVRSVDTIVQRRLGPQFSGHSMRAGFVTTSLERGADPLKVMKITRHKRVETLAGYDRREAFKDHAGDDFL